MNFKTNILGICYYLASANKAKQRSVELYFWTLMVVQG